MKERPIIICTELIPKVLDGSKTKTRRVIKDKNIKSRWRDNEGEHILAVCPYGQVGERLWVRETFAYESPDGDRYVTVTPNETKILYHATDDWEGVRVPSIHMPRWASRIDLEITAIRVERLQEITEADAIKEGIIVEQGHYMVVCRPFEDSGGYASPRDAYYILWNSINKDYPWESNCWVWVIEFKRI